MRTKMMRLSKIIKQAKFNVIAYNQLNFIGKKLM